MQRYENNMDDGSNKVMADLFMALTIILISTSVILPNKLATKENSIPDDVIWHDLYRAKGETCLDNHCYRSNAQALSKLSGDDYLRIKINKTTDSSDVFELVRYAQHAGFQHIFLEKE